MSERWARLREDRGLLAVIVVAELIAIIGVSTIDQHNHVDGEVYRLGAQSWLAGRDFYDDLPATETGLRLPFIYPPFAAIIFTPLALVPKPLAITLLTLMSHVALLVTLYVVLRSATFLAPYRDRVLVAVGAVLPLATLTEPVRETIGYGQINIALMAMVAVDCLWRTDGDKPLPYPRGMLIGLAAGLKLTPAVFVLFFLLRRDYRAMVISLLSFLATVLLGVVLAFREAGKFWLREMFASSNMSFGPGFTGNTGVYAGNQSMRAELTKMGLPEPWLAIVFGVVALVVAAMAVVGMRHAVQRRDLPIAFAINAVLGLLVSPISWSHHWVLVLPALVLVWGAAFVHQNWAMLLISSIAVIFYLIGAHWSMPQGNGKELEWNVFEHLIGSGYVYLGVGFICYTAAQWWRARKATVRSVSTPGAPVS